MKKLGVALLSACFLLGAASCNKSSDAEEYKIITVNNIKYLTYKAPEVEPVAMVVGYTPEIAEVVEIPSTVEGYTVNAIRNGSFMGAGFSKVTIPDTVLYIGKNSFATCLNLQEVNLSPNISVIHEGTFYGCGELASITIPKNVYTIGARAFSCCSTLSIVTLENGSNLVELGSSCFYACDNLETVDLGYAINLDTIPDYCFADCYSLSTVILGKNTLEIGEGAFQDCYTLKSIDLPSTLTTIYDEAFSSCDLEQIFIPKSIFYIGSNVFDNNSKDFKILFEDSALPSLIFEGFNCGYPYVLGATKNTKTEDVFVTSGDVLYCINNHLSENPGAMLFKPTKTLEGSFTVPATVTFQSTKTANVTKIENGAFYKDEKLTGVDLSSANLVSVGTESFSHTSINEAKFGANFKTIGDMAFASCLKMTKVDLSELTIAEGTNITIGSGAFYYDYNLTEVVLPTASGIKVIGPGAFCQCRKLATVSNLDKVTNLALSGYTFAECYALGSNEAQPFKITSNFKQITSSDFAEWGTVNKQYIEIAKDAYTIDAGGSVILNAVNEDEEKIVLSKADEETYKNEVYFHDAIIKLESKE